jgi:DHA2 family multidrug resistance protein
VQFLSAPLAGALSRILDLRVVLGAGLALFCVGVWMMSFLTASWGFDEFLLPQIVRGSALMICMVPVNALALGTLSPDRLKNASGLYNLMRNLGGAIGLAVLNTILSDRLQLHWNRLAADVNPARASVELAIERLSTKLAAVISGDPDRAALQLVARLVTREATVMTLNDCLLVLAIMSGAALLLLPFVRKPRAEVRAGH